MKKLLSGVVGWVSLLGAIGGGLWAGFSYGYEAGIAFGLLIWFAGIALDIFFDV